MDNENVHIAQAAKCNSEIVSVGSGKHTVPKVEGNCRTDGTRAGDVSAANTALLRFSIRTLLLGTAVISLMVW